MIGFEYFRDRIIIMDRKLTDRQKKIIALVDSNGPFSISQIKELLTEDISQPTLNRDLAKLVQYQYLAKQGKARAITYSVTPQYQLLAEINIDSYFEKETDNRAANENFNHAVFDTLGNTDIFSVAEKDFLQSLQEEYQNNISTISPTLYKKEIGRLTIELSWKSSQIEGNTYSLLETEKLFLEREQAKNKTKEEATMLLNHKFALEYLLQNKDVAQALNLRVIEDVHALLIKDLEVGKNIRKRGVGITGSAYKPLDNEFQIRENLQRMCDLIHSKQNAFEKALLSIVLISYIQPFEDGNKRTGRMIGNAILISNNACPLSYRSVDSVEYKKRILLFYEQNNLAAFKELFIDQNEFGVKNYFR